MAEKRNEWMKAMDDVRELAEELLDAFMSTTYVCQKCWKRWKPSEAYPDATITTKFQVPECCGNGMSMVKENGAELN